MSARSRLQKRIDRKVAEIEGLRRSLSEAEAHLRGLQEAASLIPADDGASVQGNPNKMREGTLIARARDLLRRIGKPLHVKDILKMLGEPTDKNKKAALSGHIASYVRRGEVFTRTGPNTFGLLEWETDQETDNNKAESASKNGQGKAMESAAKSAGNRVDYLADVMRS